jgi:signal transduction histidine kinase
VPGGGNRPRDSVRTRTGIQLSIRTLLAGVAPPLPSRYRAPRRTLRHIERVLAAARAFFTVVGCVAIYIDPTEPDHYALLVYSLLIAYAAYSLAVLVLLRRGRIGPAPSVLHTIDVAWTIALTAFSRGPISPFFLFFVFTLLAAAFRWGARETLLTTAVVVIVLLAEGLALAALPRLMEGVINPDVDLNRLITRVPYLLMMGVLLAYLADQQQLLRAESVAISHVMHRPRVENGLRQAIRDIGEEFLELFNARAMVLAVREDNNEEAYLWTVEPAADADDVQVRVSPLDPNVCSGYLGQSTDPALIFAHHVGAGADLSAVSWDEESETLREANPYFAPKLIKDRAFHSFLSARTAFGSGWEGRLFLLDARKTPAIDVQLRFLATLVEYVSPAIYNVYLLRRLRARVGAAERARVGRELHDGAIQTLLGVELEVHALRRRAVAEAQALVADLQHVQEQLRKGVLDLRDLMHQLRPAAVERTEHIPDVLASIVDRFRRETGISARFVTDRERTEMRPRVAVEVVRITQEALVNVRKHSHARHVDVQLTARDGLWHLTISDNGRGFGFDGRLTGAELDDRCLGPAIIRERSRAIGAHLTVESTRGHGASVEILIPLATHA